VRQTSEQHIAWLAGVYLAADMAAPRRDQIIDALIDHGSPAAQAAIVEKVGVYVCVCVCVCDACACACVCPSPNTLLC
jgi:hypothetical protein